MARGVGRDVGRVSTVNRGGMKRALSRGRARRGSHGRASRAARMARGVGRNAAHGRVSRGGTKRTVLAAGPVSLSNRRAPGALADALKRLHH
jgi:hypothetical protein